MRRARRHDLASLRTLGPKYESSAAVPVRHSERLRQPPGKGEPRCVLLQRLPGLCALSWQTCRHSGRDGRNRRCGNPRQVPDFHPRRRGSGLHVPHRERTSALVCALMQHSDWQYPARLQSLLCRPRSHLLGRSSEKPGEFLRSCAHAGKHEDRQGQAKVNADKHNHISLAVPRFSDSRSSGWQLQAHAVLCARSGNPSRTT
jgi:hypothetical protein